MARVGKSRKLHESRTKLRKVGTSRQGLQGRKLPRLMYLEIACEVFVLLECGTGGREMELAVICHLQLLVRCEALFQSSFVPVRILLLTDEPEKSWSFSFVKEKYKTRSIRRGFIERSFLWWLSNIFYHMSPELPSPYGGFRCWTGCWR